jgi:hypothetical protein
MGQPDSNILAQIEDKDKEEGEIPIFNVFLAVL